MNSANTVEVYVQLFDEGTPTARATQAVKLGSNLYKLLPTPHYDPEDEVWEFLPGSVVRCKWVKDDKGEAFLYAVEKI